MNRLSPIASPSLPLAALLCLACSHAALAGGEACRAAAAAEEACKSQAAAARTVEIAICLDTSGSMNGLIDSARAKIWDIVSDLARAAPTPKLRVALLTYGNDGYTQESGWTSVDSNLTDDLDTVSMKLFALHTNGGTEFVGRAVDRATRDLAWSGGEASLRVIIIAGNEGADQDQQVKYQDACKRAIEKGILVNSIYCGNAGDNLVAAWQEVARLADGRSACIDQNNGTVVVETPFDQELVALSASLNTTYLPYGAKGEWSAGNQTQQDGNASSLGAAVSAQRCVTKGGSAYTNAQWDLVDACKAADFKLEAIEAKDLPEAMRTMTIEQRRALVAQRAGERQAIQAKIKEADAKRAKFVADAIAARGGDATSFDRVIRDAVRAQASARGFTFPTDAASAAAGTNPAGAPASVPAAAPGAAPALAAPARQAGG